jgi:alpha-aminoadipate carrier protein LysW
MEMKGICPECEFSFTVSDMVVGESLACPECALTLQVRDISGSMLVLEMIESELPDWGQ